MDKEKEMELRVVDRQDERDLLVNDLVDVWEASVKATHHFLSEEDIRFFKSHIPGICRNIEKLICVFDVRNQLTAFMGIEGDNVEMLFIHPEYRKIGIGKRLMEVAVKDFHIRKVDVNEQNEQAAGFYVKIGFHVVKRDAWDGMGKPYPILHMEM